MMKVSQAMRIALAAIIVIAAAPSHHSIAARYIANNAGVPQEYLLKILQMLTRAGILHSDTGRGGGYRLGRQLDGVTLLDVYTAVHKPLCFGSTETTPIPLDEALYLRSTQLLQSVACQIDGLLESITLHDLLCHTSSASTLHGISRS